MLRTHRIRWLHCMLWITGSVALPATSTSQATLPPRQLIGTVPQCAWSCLVSFIQTEYPRSVCRDLEDVSCLCRNPGTSGYNLGEVAFACAVEDCKGQLSQPSTDALYRICAAQGGAAKNTHVIIPTTFGPKSTSATRSTTTVSTSKPTSSVSDSTSSTSQRQPSTSRRSSTTTKQETSTSSPSSHQPTPTSDKEPANLAEPLPSKSKGLHGSQIVGVAVACSVVFLLLILSIVLCFHMRRRRRNMEQLDSGTLSNEEFRPAEKYMMDTHGISEHFNKHHEIGPQPAWKDPRRTGPGGVGVSTPPVRYKAIHPPDQNLFHRYPETPEDVGRSPISQPSRSTVPEFALVPPTPPRIYDSSRAPAKTAYYASASTYHESPGSSMAAAREDVPPSAYQDMTNEGVKEMYAQTLPNNAGAIGTPPKRTREAPSVAFPINTSILPLQHRNSQEYYPGMNSVTDHSTSHDTDRRPSILLPELPGFAHTPPGRVSAASNVTQFEEDNSQTRPVFLGTKSTTETSSTDGPSTSSPRPSMSDRIETDSSSETVPPNARLDMKSDIQQASLKPGHRPRGPSLTIDIPGKNKKIDPSVFKMPSPNTYQGICGQGPCYRPDSTNMAGRVGAGLPPYQSTHMHQNVPVGIGLVGPSVQTQTIVTQPQTSQNSRKNSVSRRGFSQPRPSPPVKSYEPSSGPIAAQQMFHAAARRNGESQGLNHGTGGPQGGDMSKLNTSPPSAYHRRTASNMTFAPPPTRPISKGAALRTNSSSSKSRGSSISVGSRTGSLLSKRLGSDKASQMFLGGPVNHVIAAMHGRKDSTTLSQSPPAGSSGSSRRTSRSGWLQPRLSTKGASQQSRHQPRPSQQYIAYQPPAVSDGAGAQSQSGQDVHHRRQPSRTEQLAAARYGAGAMTFVPSQRGDDLFLM